jgi:hypothetical protein
MKQLIFIILLLTQTAYAQQSTTFYISPSGNDKNTGTLEKPFATPEAARDAIRKARSKQNNENFAVILRGGTYFRKNTFDLTAADSNTTYRAYQGEKVVFHGGQQLSGSVFSVCNDPAILERLLPEARGKVYVADLKKEGIIDYGVLKQKGFGTTPSPLQIELFLDGKPLHLARYPNVGQPILKIGKVYDKGSTPRYGDLSNRGGEFGYEFDRPNRWTKADDVWLHGKFSFGYADDHLKIAKIDTDKKALKMAFPHLYGISSSIYIDSTKWEDLEGTRVRGYYAYNLLEEIDQEGEYYLDRQTGKLYVYAAQIPTTAKAELSLLEDPFVRLTNTRKIRIQGFDFTCSRGMGIYQESTHYITLDHCRFNNLGTVAISMGQRFQSVKVTYRKDGSPETEQEASTDFTHNRISNCTIYDVGTGGVFVAGGDRKTLTSGHNEVVNCEFYRIDRIRDTYSGGVSVTGVGTLIKNCYFHDIKHLAISFKGNNHLFEYNRFDKICYDADDMGAIYSGRNPSARGTIIQYNYFSNIEPADKETKMAGVYIDDGSGGMIIRNNLFYKTGNRGKNNNFAAIFFHGGFDNKVQNNIFMECDVAVGNQPWDKKRFNDWLKSPMIQERLTKEVDISSEVYVKAYPELKNYFQDQGLRLNYVTNNLFLNSVTFLNGEYKLNGNTQYQIASPITPESIDLKQVGPRTAAIKPFPFEKVGLVK